MKVERADGRRTIGLETTRDGDVELSVCRNGYQTTVVALDRDMLSWLQQLIGQYLSDDNFAEQQALLNQWNSAVLASGSRTHGGAVGVIANMRRLLIDIHKADSEVGTITLTDDLRDRIEQLIQ